MFRRIHCFLWLWWSVETRKIRKTVGTANLPNIYLLHGEIDDADINALYNHPKIKAMISLTRGEGFGRPLLEFTTTGKPLIVSGWSGHVDFLRPDLSTFVGGKLENLHPSSVVDKMLLKESKWFTFDKNEAKRALKHVFKNYHKVVPSSRRQKSITIKHFSFENMQDLIVKLLDNYVPFFPVEYKFVEPIPSKIEMPKLNK